MCLGAGGDLDDNVLADTPTDDPLVEEPKALPQYDREGLQEPQYAHRLHNSILKSEYFTDPGKGWRGWLAHTVRYSATGSYCKFMQIIFGTNKYMHYFTKYNILVHF